MKGDDVARAPGKLRFGELSLEGRSRAGDQTWLRVHPPGLAFDSGRGAAPLAGARQLFLTHGHLDHALGVPYVLSQRSLHGLGETALYCPRPIAGRLRELIAAASRLEEVEYSYRLRPLEPGDREPVGRDLLVEAFAVDHGVPSLGYHLVRRKRHLAPAYREVPVSRLVELKRRGEPVEETHEAIWLSYCGDTGAGVFDSEPRLFESEILVLECTFLAPESRERAVRFGHIHLDDLESRVGSFRNRALVLHHLSRRHTHRELEAEVGRRLGALASRVHLLGGA